LAGVVASHLPDVDPDLQPDLHRLISEVERGQRIVQPRLRHRYQVDRHGLARSRHRLLGVGEQVEYAFENHGSALQQVLGAVYATERLAPVHRHAVAACLHKALRWKGPVGPSFLGFLTGVNGVQASSLLALADPVAWALDVLGFGPGTVAPSKKDVMAQYRLRLREVHPDHGGDERDAHKHIGDLAEARRILLG
jgi:hypothetical protein